MKVNILAGCGGGERRQGDWNRKGGTIHAALFKSSVQSSCIIELKIMTLLGGQYGLHERPRGAVIHGAVQPLRGDSEQLRGMCDDLPNG
jgi:hypothetical protein